MMADDRRQQLADVLAGWPIGSGYYGTTVGSDEARDMADALLPLLDRVAADAAAEALEQAVWLLGRPLEGAQQWDAYLRARAAELRAPARTDEEN